MRIANVSLEQLEAGSDDSQFTIHYSLFNWREELAAIMVRAAGPLRNGDDLRAGLAAIEAWPAQAAPDDAEGVTAANAALVARLVLSAALLREESRGGHFRNDFPQQRDVWRAHSVQARGHETFVIASVAPERRVAHAAD